MKKSNIITLLFLCISIIAVMLFMKFKNAEPVDNNNTEISQETGGNGNPIKVDDSGWGDW